MDAVKGLFGGGNKDAAKQQEQSQQLQQVANDRQLSSLQQQDTAVAATRKAPRGKRLFEDGPDSASAVLG
ncbi:hypothetical protein [Rhizobium tumorigenes]|uniref:hypothetical protein n=1 Tax=Rhizobium tumorigenes TaxID=2041385 RepID=UPI00241D6AB1|nr:hypothetical protein [Rhizobium tumorigenes]WFS02207.1 hypothetical protein PR016_06230 [Rhizobium tumorigenes]